MRHCYILGALNCLGDKVFVSDIIRAKKELLQSINKKLFSEHQEEGKGSHSVDERDFSPRSPGRRVSASLEMLKSH